MGQHDKMTLGCRLAVAERMRQISAEGYTAEHDAAHVQNELRDAAIWYSCLGEWPEAIPETAPLWPFRDKARIPMFTKTMVDRPRCMVRAIAMMIAELDRMLQNEWLDHPYALKAQREGAK